MPQRALPPPPPTAEWESLPPGWAKWKDDEGVFYLDITTNARRRDKPTRAVAGDLRDESRFTLRDSTSDRMTNIVHSDDRQSMDTMEWESLREGVLNKVALPEDYKVIFDEFVDKMSFNQTTDGRFECEPSDYEVALLAVASVDAKRVLSGQSMPALGNTSPKGIDVDHRFVRNFSLHDVHSDHKPQIQPHGQHEQEQNGNSLDSVMSIESTPLHDEEEDFPAILQTPGDDYDINGDDGDQRRSTMSELRMMSRVEGQVPHSQEEQSTFLGIEDTQNHLEQLQCLHLKRTRSLSLNDMDLAESDSSDDADSSPSSISSSDGSVSANDRDEKLLSDLWVSEEVPPAVYAQNSTEEQFLKNHHRSRTFDCFSSGDLDDHDDASSSTKQMERRSKLREYRSPRTKTTMSHLKAHKILHGTNWHSHSLPRCRVHHRDEEKEDIRSNRLPPAPPQLQSRPNTTSNLRILLPSEERSLRKERARKLKKRKERELKMKKRHSGSSLMRSVGQLFHGLKRRPKTPNSR